MSRHAMSPEEIEYFRCFLRRKARLTIVSDGTLPKSVDELLQNLKKRTKSHNDKGAIPFHYGKGAIPFR